MPHTKTLKRLCCTFSEECLSLIDLVRDGQSRSEWIETQLWKLRPIQNTAKKYRIKKKERRRRGRISND